MMGIAESIGVSYEALIVILKVSLPALLVTTAVALITTVFQQVSQLQDASLQMQLKIISTLLMIFITGPMMYMLIRDFTLVIFERIALMGT